MAASDRRLALSALALAIAAALAVPAAPASAAAGVRLRSSESPFCIMRGGRWGQNSHPQICGFFDYQQCLQASAQIPSSNCVVNIDFPGEVVRTPDGWRGVPRTARR